MIMRLPPEAIINFPTTISKKFILSIQKMIKQLWSRKFSLNLNTDRQTIQPKILLEEMIE